MRVAIVGIGQTKFGEHWNMSIKDLVAEAGIKALEDAGISGKEVEALFGGSMSAGLFVSQEHVGAMLADAMGLNPKAALRVEGACASGGLALRMGYLAVASGQYNIVVVGGVEKMTDVPVERATLALGAAGDFEWEVFNGATFPALYALMARRYMHEFGASEEQLAMVSVKNHKYGAKNPYAQFRRKIKVDDVLSSPVVADPLKLLDCSPITDGACALVLASEKIAKKICDTPVWILGSGHATDTLALHSRKSLVEEMATIEAAKQAYRQAKVKPEQIDVAEVHDCFTIAEILAIEDLGFFEKGEGAKAVEEGETEIGGKIPVNVSGGLKSVGHPVGATGVRQAVDIVRQLRGEAFNQVDGATIGLTQNAGGTGATVVVHIFGV